MMKNTYMLKSLGMNASTFKLAAVTLALGSTMVLSGCGSDSNSDKDNNVIKHEMAKNKDLGQKLNSIQKTTTEKSVTGTYGPSISGTQLPPVQSVTGTYGPSISGTQLPPVQSVTGTYGPSISGTQLPPVQSVTGTYGPSISGQKLPPQKAQPTTVKSVTGTYGPSISGTQLPPQKATPTQKQIQQPVGPLADLTYVSRLMHVLKTFKSAANGAPIYSGGQNNMPLMPDSLAPTSGNNFNGTVNFDQTSIVYLNGSMNASNWHCYKTAANGVTLARNSAGLIIDGTITEYKYLFPANKCSTDVIASFSFSNMNINDQLGITQGEVTVSAPNTADTQFDSNELLIANKLASLTAHFGDAWAKMQADTIQKATKANPGLLTLNKQTQQAELNVAGLQSDLIEYKSLDKSSLLAGTVFGGAPGATTPASVKWCNIVNIPTDKSAATIQAQAVISMNCARSVARYCDGHEGFKGGIFDAVAPLAWSDEVANAAMDNTKAQQAKGQGHWITHNMAQNAFVIATTSAITPIFGYTSPRTDGHVNNAGANSWAGHPGHCQNVMGKGSHEFGVAWLLDPQAKLDYWTENLR